MKIDVRYFAAAREAAGRSAESLEVEDGCTVAVLRGRLLEAHPALSGLAAGLRVSVGVRFAEEDDELSDGDVVALIPPVSGG